MAKEFGALVKEVESLMSDSRVVGREPDETSWELVGDKLKDLIKKNTSVKKTKQKSLFSSFFGPESKSKSKTKSSSKGKLSSIQISKLKKLLVDCENGAEQCRQGEEMKEGYAMKRGKNRARKTKRVRRRSSRKQTNRRRNRTKRVRTKRVRSKRVRSKRVRNRTRNKRRRTRSKRVRRTKRVRRR